MFRQLPTWFFLLCLLLGLIGTVTFGWIVKSELKGGPRLGLLGDASVLVASFPDMIREVATEIHSRATGSYKDEALTTPREHRDLSGFSPAATNSEISLPGLLIKADRDHMAPGWRIVVGAFAIDGEVENAALFFSPTLKLVRVMVLDEIAVGNLTPRPKYKKFVHGVEFLRDGSVVFTFDGSISLQRLDRCGERIWTIPGAFHHSVTADDTQASIWTLNTDEKIIRVSVADGSVLQTITMDDVIRANPDIDILELRRLHSNELGANSRNTDGDWLPERFHFNDVEPLPAAYAERFPGFQAGDLLISSRSLNLIFALDPQSLEVRWWRVGAVQRQHDPDWLPDGKIEVFNNRMSRDFSEIVSIDPASFERQTVLDGRDYDFYTRIRGKHQRLGDGSLVITSPQQGRAFEVDRSGAIVFEIVNTKPGDDRTNYAISELRWLPPDYFGADFDTDRWVCPN